MVNVSNIATEPWELDSEAISVASREIVLHRLPRLLVVALVSAIETCFEDLVAINLAYAAPKTPEPDRLKRASKVMRGGPQDYLPEVERELGVSMFQRQWEWLPELVATRNIIVHEAQPIADDRYVRNAGTAARAKEGEALVVDNSYLTCCYALAKAAMLYLIRIVDPSAGTGSILDT